ncbi:hypothetical protein EVAR_13068_1 [Eumeta japonica]|uniref:Uncharacterized protein n=1 Tax=Eumeta variegata TaxID=151549 RepID=A0A4C1VFW3_EUMVA|nr:hypothetical protein EVAR_13068_1 [Eumeta japonica]
MTVQPQQAALGADSARLNYHVARSVLPSVVLFIAPLLLQLIARSDLPVHGRIGGQLLRRYSRAPPPLRLAHAARALSARKHILRIERPLMRRNAKFACVPRHIFQQFLIGLLSLKEDGEDLKMKRGQVSLIAVTNCNHPPQSPNAVTQKNYRPAVLLFWC